MTEEDSKIANHNHKILSTYSNPNPLVFLDLTLDDDPIGRIVLELFSNVVPKTAEHFRSMCKTGLKGVFIDRIVQKAFIQAGTGDESMIREVDFVLKHESAGLLSMSPDGFRITTNHCPHLDGKNLVFGRVIRGLGIVNEIDALETKDERPLKAVNIVNCGQFASKIEDFGLGEVDGTEDVFPFHPEDVDMDWFLVENFDRAIDMADKIKRSGNHFYTCNDLVRAVRKYKKVLKYINHLRDCMGSTRDEEEAAIRAVELPCYLNLAACFVKLGDFDSALVECQKVLEVDQDNQKAIFRRAQARLGKNDFEVALDDLRRVKVDGKAVEREVNKVRKAQEKYLKKEKEIYCRMFN